MWASLIFCANDGALAVKIRGNDDENCGNPALARPRCSPAHTHIQHYTLIDVVTSCVTYNCSIYVCCLQTSCTDNIIFYDTFVAIVTRLPDVD